MKRLIATVVAAAMVVGSTGSAMAHKAKRPHKHRPVAHHVQAPYAYNHYAPAPRRKDNTAALAIGLLAVGTIAAIAASKNGGNVNFGYGTQYGPQPYVPPPAYGYGGGYGAYAPAGYGYAPAYAPPPVRTYERETVVEYRREYERVREVGY